MPNRPDRRRVRSRGTTPRRARRQGGVALFCSSQTTDLYASHRAWLADARQRKRRCLLPPAEVAGHGRAFGRREFDRDVVLLFGARPFRSPIGYRSVVSSAKAPDPPAFSIASAAEFQPQKRRLSRLNCHHLCSLGVALGRSARAPR